LIGQAICAELATPNLPPRTDRSELAMLMAGFSKEKLEDGWARVVRHGRLREREVMTGIGPVPVIGPVLVKVPRVRDRGVGAGAGKNAFTPAILPRFLGRAKSVENLLPRLYRKGVSTGNLAQALAVLPEQNAKGAHQRAVGHDAHAVERSGGKTAMLGTNATLARGSFPVSGRTASPSS
jgi:hypothetical protein